MTKRKLLPTPLIHFIILGLLVVLFKLPSIDIPFDEDSGVHAYHARLILDGEPLYLTHHPTHHLPGSYYTFALLFFLFGDKFQTIKIFLLFWVWINSFIIYQIGYLYKNRSTGFLSAVLFIVVGTLTQLSGDTAATEILANLPLTLIIYLAYLIHLNKKDTKFYFLIGILSAIAIFYKAVYLSSLFAVGVMLFAQGLVSKNNQRRRRFLSSWAMIALGGFLVSIMVIAYFSAVGTLNEMLFTITMGVNYLKSSLPFFFIPVLPLLMLGQANFIFMIFSMIGIVWITVEIPALLKKKSNLAAFKTMLVAWSVGSIFAAGVSRFPYPHYSLLLIPPFSIIISVFLVELLEHYSFRKSPIAVISKFFCFAIIFAILFYSLENSRKYFQIFMEYKIGNIDYSEFLKYGPYDGEKYYETYEVAKYIRNHTRIDVYIFSWTRQPQIYYLSNRRSSSDVLWTDYIPIIGPPQRVFDQKPIYVIVESNPIGGEENPHWLSDVLSKSYLQEIIIANHILFRRLQP